MRVTDSASSNVFGYSSVNITQAVSTSTTTTTTVATSAATTASSGGGTSGGSSGGAAGGGVHRPSVYWINNGYVVNSIAQLNTFNVTICNQTLHATENFITPNYAGVTINGGSYALYPNVTTQLHGLPPQCYVRLTGISYIPLQQTIQLLFITNVKTIKNVSGISARLNITLNATIPSTIDYVNANELITFNSGLPPFYTANVSITNATYTTPAPQSGYIKLVAVNVSTGSGVIRGLNISEGYSCTLPGGSIAPYQLQNGTWVKIARYNVSPSACRIAYDAPINATIALMQTISLTTSTTQTTSTTTPTILTITAPTRNQTNAVKPSALLNLLRKYRTPISLAIIAVIAIMAALWLLSLRKKPGKPERPAMPASPAPPKPAPGPGEPTLPAMPWEKIGKK